MLHRVATRRERPAAQASGASAARRRRTGVGATRHVASYGYGHGRLARTGPARTHQGRQEPQWCATLAPRSRRVATWRPVGTRRRRGDAERVPSHEALGETTRGTLSTHWINPSTHTGVLLSAHTGYSGELRHGRALATNLDSLRLARSRFARDDLHSDGSQHGPRSRRKAHAPRARARPSVHCAMPVCR